MTIRHNPNRSEQDEQYEHMEWFTILYSCYKGADVQMREPTYKGGAVNETVLCVDL